MSTGPHRPPRVIPVRWDRPVPKALRARWGPLARPGRPGLLARRVRLAHRVLIQRCQARRVQLVPLVQPVQQDQKGQKDPLAFRAFKVLQVLRGQMAQKDPKGLPVLRAT